MKRHKLVKIEMKKEDITTNTNAIQWDIREYSENWYQINWTA
jgi:hypothetical protein